MPTSSRPRLALALTLIAAGSPAAGGPAAGGAQDSRLGPVEALYANLLDGASAVSAIDSGLMQRVDGLGRSKWQARADRSARYLAIALPAIVAADLPAPDARALQLMRAGLASYRHGATASLTPRGATCAAAKPVATQGAALHDSLVACFDELARAIPFEGRTYTRVAVLQLLSELPDSTRRKSLLLTLQPLWQALNADDAADSPYRRLIRATAGDPAGAGYLDSAARTLGVSAGEIESWLRQILEAWSNASTERAIEPWDFLYQYSAAGRTLAACAAPTSPERVSARWYRDLGADLAALGVLHDLKPRPGKAPLAYTDYVRIGRMLNGRWRPAIARVSGNYQLGGARELDELIHEDGHAVSYAAIHARPAFVYSDSLFDEAFADVAAWSSTEPEWQRKYLGCAATPAEAWRARMVQVILDVAWSLFEIRMLHDPARDPNQLWTEITSRYLHIAPHPEWSWWALRVQLFADPGYMVNYGLGATITAEIRARITTAIGPWNTGNGRWYEWVSANLLRDGNAQPTGELLQRVLGRALSPRALLEQMALLTAPN